MKGWVFDYYPDSKAMVVWLWREEGVVKLRIPFRPYLYVDSSCSRRLFSLLPKLKIPLKVKRVERETLQGGRATFFMVQASTPGGFQLLSSVLQRKMPPEALYNVDIPLEQLFAYETGLFPLAQVELEVRKGWIQEYEVLDNPLDIRYPLPPLRVMELYPDVPYNPNHGTKAIPLVAECEEERVLLDENIPEALTSFLKRWNPDVIVTRFGDSFILPRLASLVPFHRDKAQKPSSPARKGRSYFSYGKTIYQAAHQVLRGRWHIDAMNSFLFRECGLEGIMELARMSGIPVQRLVRTSPGTAITSMEMLVAYRRGIPIPWRKTQLEDFKTAAQLVELDMGGLTYRPKPGFYEGVAELDFSSMYPSIMVNYNLSYETIDCSCCGSSGKKVPGTPYHTCRKRMGIVPLTLIPILKKRALYKRLYKKTKEPKYQQRQTALKWLLVVSFGYMGYRNAKFGRIEGHEAITSIGRELLLTAKEIAEEKGYTFLHALTDSLWLKKEGATRGDYLALAKEISRKTGIQVKLEGIYRWVVFPPSKTSSYLAVPNRFFGVFEDGEMKVRGLACRRRDTPLLVKSFQEEALALLSRAGNRREYQEVLHNQMKKLKEDYIQALRDHRVPIDALKITKIITKAPQGYTKATATALVSSQLSDMGIELHPGEAIEYVVVNSKEKVGCWKVVPVSMYGGEGHDVGYYVGLIEEGWREVKEVVGVR